MTSARTVSKRLPKAPTSACWNAATSAIGCRSPETGSSPWSSGARQWPGWTLPRGAGWYAEVGALYDDYARVPDPLMLPFQTSCWRAEVDHSKLVIDDDFETCSRSSFERDELMGCRAGPIPREENLGTAVGVGSRGNSGHPRAAAGYAS